MVFFTCNACGESLKKAQVDKHVNICRGCQVLSCIDCGKDFCGNDYKNHNQCISEDQKYGGKGYQAKANKGDVKQQQWIQKIQEAMNKPGISGNLKNVLDQVSTFSNVPRKKAKFQNWMKSSLKIHQPSLHDQVWEICSAASSSVEEPKQQPEEPKQQPASDSQVSETNGSHQNGGPEGPQPPDQKKKLNKRERKEARQMKSGKKEKGAQKNGSTEEGEETSGTETQKKKRKRKRGGQDGEQDGDDAGEQTTTTTKRCKKRTNTSLDGEAVTEAGEEEEGETEDAAGPKGKFNWKGTIKAVLRQAPEEGISVKKLRKKVLAGYYTFSGEANFKSEEVLLATFNKKITGNPKFRVLKEKVRLVK